MRKGNSGHTVLLMYIDTLKDETKTEREREEEERK
jgi:hypothetical protein